MTTTTPKERPILFSGAMVRAILAGTKTQTRREIKPQPHAHWMPEVGMYAPTMIDRTGEQFPGPEVYGASDEFDGRKCPYGQPGDRLWVRESFQPIFAAGIEHNDTDWKTGKGYACKYPATDPIEEWIDADDNITSRCKPSIHMPRWASRLTLEVVEVRVERLGQISEADAIAEGVTYGPCRHEGHGESCPATRTAQEAFKDLWWGINGGESWERNPWVWVVEFRRVKP